MRRAFIFIILISYALTFYCQGSRWQSWYYDKAVPSVAVQGRYVWLGTYHSGVVRLDTFTNEKIHYKTDNSNIPENSVPFVAVDLNGVVWMISGGLTSFDGESWTNFNSANSGMPECSVSQFDFDSQGNIWLATNIGLVKFDGSVWTIYNTMNSGLPSNSLTQVVIDSTNKVWICNSSMICSFNDGEWESYNWEQLGLSSEWIPIYCIAVDNTDTLWIGTGYGGLLRKNGQSFSVFNQTNSGISGDWVACITFDMDGNVWVGAWNDFTYIGGVSMYNGTTWQTWTTSGLGRDNIDFNVVNCIATQPDKVWAGTARGLNEFDGTTWHQHSIGTNGLVNGWVSPVAVDHSDVVWMGCGGSTVGQGLIVFDGEYWGQYNAVVGGLMVDRYNRVWIMDNNRVKRFDNNTGEMVTINTPIACTPGNQPFNMSGFAMSSDDTFWLVTNINIGKLQNGVWTVYNHENSGIPIDPQWGMPLLIGAYVDPHDNLWVSTDRQGLIKFDGEDWEYYNESTTGIDIRRGGVFVDSQDNLWIVEGFFNVLLKFDGISWTVYNASNSPIPSGSGVTYLQCLTEDSNGRIWLGTSNGLCIIDGDEWQVFTPSNSGLPSDDVCSIAFDSFGNAWIGTLGGLAVYYNDSTTNNDIHNTTIVDTFQLSCFPNPFNPDLNISFNLLEPGYADIGIFNIKGQKVASIYQDSLAKGEHRMAISLKDTHDITISSGIYFVRIEQNGITQMRKVTLTK